MTTMSVQDINHWVELTWDWPDRVHTTSECLELAEWLRTK